MIRLYVKVPEEFMRGILLLLLLLSYLPTPPVGQDITQGQFVSGF